MKDSLKCLFPNKLGEQTIVTAHYELHETEYPADWYAPRRFGIEFEPQLVLALDNTIFPAGDLPAGFWETIEAVARGEMIVTDEPIEIEAAP